MMMGPTMWSERWGWQEILGGMVLAVALAPLWVMFVGLHAGWHAHRKWLTWSVRAVGVLAVLGIVLALLWP